MYYLDLFGNEIHLKPPQVRTVVGKSSPTPSKPSNDRLFTWKSAIYPDRIVFYKSPVNGWAQSARHKLNQDNLLDKSTNGKISKKAARKISKAITWMLFTAKNKRVYCNRQKKWFWFRINFITLTLPFEQSHPDKEITNRCLGNWLDTAKKSFGLKNYVWKAEKQSGGNIHYHIVTDCYIHYTELRRTWNQSLNLLGYIDRFESKHHHRDAPTEQVKSVKDIQKVANYIGAYMSKNVKFSCIGKLIIDKDKVVREILYGSDEYNSVKSMSRLGKVIGSILGPYYQPVNGRLWGCSHSLSKCKPVTLYEEDGDMEALDSFIRLCNFNLFRPLDKYGNLNENCVVHSGKVATESQKHFPWLYHQLHKSVELASVPKSESEPLREHVFH